MKTDFYNFNFTLGVPSSAAKATGHRFGWELVGLPKTQVAPVLIPLPLSGLNCSKKLADNSGEEKAREAMNEVSPRTDHSEEDRMEEMEDCPEEVSVQGKTVNK